MGNLKSEETEKLICEHCDNEINPNNEYYTTEDDEIICEHCYLDNYFTCEYCGKVHHMDESYCAQDTYSIYCENCKDSTLFYCEDCGEYYEEYNNMYQLANGDYICEHCFDYGNYYYCENCGDLFYIDEMYEQNNCLYCDDCYEESIVENYHNHKDCFYFYKTQKDFAKTPLYFGFELEVENNDNLITNNKMAEIIKDIMQYTVVFENDSSLNNGFEIISHPMTFNYIWENQAKIKNMLESLINNGFISHNAGTCGFHIHLSKNYFTENQIDKLQFLIEKFKKELTIFSRRTNDQINRWTQFITDYTNSTNEILNIDFVKKYKNKSDRYQVLNLCNNDTIEFRLLRGTLKETTFFASIQLLNNMSRIIKRKSLQELEKITFADLIEYGKNNNALKTYCTQKRLIENVEELKENKIEVQEVMALCV